MTIQKWKTWESSRREMARSISLRCSYNSELTLLEGGEHIRALKLSEKKSAPLRCYAACCGTPFAAPDGLCFVYPALLQPNPNKKEDEVDFTPFQPTNNIYIESAPEGSAPPPEGCQATSGVPPGLMCRFVGKLATCPFRTRPENALVTIGIDSISLEE